MHKDLRLCFHRRVRFFRGEKNIFHEWEITLTSLCRQQGRKDSMRNEILTALPEISRALLSVDLKFITPRVFGFHLKIIFRSFRTHNPPQKCLLKGSSAVDWLISTQLPLAAFHILFNFVSVHREIPKIAPTRNASNNTWWLNKSTPAVRSKRRMAIRHAENGFWLSPGTRCDYGDERQKTHISKV